MYGRRWPVFGHSIQPQEHTAQRAEIICQFATEQKRVRGVKPTVPSV